MFTDRTKWIVVALAFLVPIGFAGYTGHAWEDYFITLRASRNLVEGHGLVFNVGERVHTFTSPLGTLLPALCTYLAGADHEDLGLWFFRILNAGFLAAAAFLVWGRFDTLRVGSLGRVVFFGLVLADPKVTDFAINGMETAILAFFVARLWTELEAPAGPRAAPLALAFGGLMWTRPDAFILAGAMVLPHFAFRGQADGTAVALWPALRRGALLGGLLYVPWFAWAWWYYGSPVPHTITAKSGVLPPVDWARLPLVPVRILLGQNFNGSPFLPTYAEFGGWPDVVWAFARTLTLLALFLWLVPRFATASRRLSLAVFLGSFYLSSITLYPWYLPPWTLLASLALALAVDSLARRPVMAGVLASALRIACLLVVLTQAAVLGCVAWQMRTHQRFVEAGVRRPIGEWLRANAGRGDTVFLEPLGYIGYFSRLKTYDFPGLSSTEVVRAIRAGAMSYPALIAQLQPQWLVLRPFELVWPDFASSSVLDDYSLISVRSAQTNLDSVRFLPGRRWCEFEAQYYLYRRKANIPLAGSAP